MVIVRKLRDCGKILMQKLGNSKESKQMLLAVKELRLSESKQIRLVSLASMIEDRVECLRTRQFLLAFWAGKFFRKNLSSFVVVIPNIKLHGSEHFFNLLTFDNFNIASLGSLLLMESLVGRMLQRKKKKLRQRYDNLFIRLLPSNSAKREKN